MLRCQVDAAFVGAVEACLAVCIISRAARRRFMRERDMDHPSSPQTWERNCQTWRRVEQALLLPNWNDVGNSDPENVPIREMTNA
jgi:hypothetical protein